MASHKNQYSVGNNNILTMEDHSLLKKIIEDYKKRPEKSTPEYELKSTPELEDYELGGLDLIILGFNVIFCGKDLPEDVIPQCRCCGTKVQQLYNKMSFIFIGIFVKFVEYYFLIYVLQVAYHNYFLDEDEYKEGQNLASFKVENKTFKVTETIWEEEDTNVRHLSSNFILGVIFDLIVFFTLICCIKNQCDAWKKLKIKTFEWWFRFIIEFLESAGILLATIWLLLPYAWTNTYDIELILNGVALLYIQEVDEGTVKLFIGNDCQNKILLNIYNCKKGNGSKVMDEIKPSKN